MEHCGHNIYICAYWMNRPLRGSEYLDWIIGLVSLLRETSPLFSTLFLIGNRHNACCLSPANRTQLTAQLIEFLPTEIAYDNPDKSDMAFSLHAYCGLGFSHTLVTTLNSSDPGVLVEVRIGKHSPDIQNTVVVTISSQIFDTPMTQNIFECIIDYCDPDNASLSTDAIDEELDQPPKEIRFGWLTYIARTVQFDAPAGLEYKKFGNGAFMQCGESPPLAGDKEGMESIVRTYRTLKEAGILSRLNLR